MRVLMVGVDKQTKGGMWTVVENYIHSEAFVRGTNLEYVSTSITGSVKERLVFTAKALLKIIAKMVKNKYDLVHIHMAERGSVYRKGIVLFLAKIFHCKTVVHMHGAEFEEWYKSLSERRQKGVRRICCRADSVLILGQYWKVFVQSLVEEPKKVHVLHNAVYVPEENSYNSEALNILFFGVAGQRKGVFDLLKAMQIAKEQLPTGTKLLIYGPEGERSVNAEIEQLKLQQFVEYKGWLPGNQKEEVFKNIALNVLPSYHEGLPMTILETMAYGIPNISTNVAAIPEAVNKENGVVIRPGDIDRLACAITELMLDVESRKQKSQLAYEKAKSEFSIDKHVSNLLEIYRELVSEA